MYLKQAMTKRNLAGKTDLSLVESGTELSADGVSVVALATDSNDSTLSTTGVASTAVSTPTLGAGVAASDPRSSHLS